MLHGMAAHSPSATGGMQQFQPPPNMPNINFNAPIIRLGVDGKPPGGPDRLGDSGGRGGPLESRGSNAEPLGNRHRLGLGAEGGGGGSRNIERDRQQVRDNMLALQPPTREEVARTIFVGGLGAGAPDDNVIEIILRCAGKLRRWTGARDAEDRKCKFGFAEYEDVESLEAAKEVFGNGIEVPVFKQGKIVKGDGEEPEPMTMRMLVVIDDQSARYIEEWMSKRREDDDARQFRLDGCKEDLRQYLASLSNADAFLTNGALDTDNAVAMTNAPANGDTTTSAATEIVNIPVALEDELADIPAEMRATVAAEIRAFRDRSSRRDLERLRREEEIDADYSRGGPGRPINRLASPPPSSAPLGPASAANGIPVGPRQGVAGAPAGPKGYRGAQIPSDYANGVAFVSGANGARGSDILDEDSDASDSELENRRKESKAAELERQFQDAERRWLNRERQRTAAQDRERNREEAEERERERVKATLAQRLKGWDDDEEERLGREEYYTDRSAWARKRLVYREREARDDDRDRQNETRAKEAERRRGSEARGAADRFLAETGAELAAAKTAEQAANPFKISLGSAAVKNKPAPQARRTMADVAGLLEEEEDAAASGLPRELRAISTADVAANAAGGADLSEPDQVASRQALATEIPTDAASLFAYEVRWSYIRPELLEREIRPFVEKKVVEYLGVQEDFLVDMVIAGLREQKSAHALISELEPALEDEASVLVRKVWRLVVFWAEAEGRGLV